MDPERARGGAWVATIVRAQPGSSARHALCSLPSAMNPKRTALLSFPAPHAQVLWDEVDGTADSTTPLPSSSARVGVDTSYRGLALPILALFVYDGPGDRALIRRLGSRARVTVLPTWPAIAAMDVAGFDVILVGDRVAGRDTAEWRGNVRRSMFMGTMALLTRRHHRGELAMELGAGVDDVVLVPFDADEVCARTEALARRANLEARLAYGALRVDPTGRTLYLGGEPISSLTHREHALLSVLVARRGAFIGTREICDELHLPDGDFANRIHLLVSRLRSKLGAWAPMVECAPSLGYRVVDLERVEHDR